MSQMPDRPVQFLPECHADTALLRYFIPDHKLSIHSFGCPEVANTMRSVKANDYRLVGLVDNDRDLDTRCNGFCKMFTVVEQAQNVILRENKIRQQYLIIIDKAIERFLIWNAEQVSIDMAGYGFTADLKQLRIQTKSPGIETNISYRNFLTDLHTRQAPGLLALKRILQNVTTP